MESPNKRRALAPLNANALPSPKPINGKNAYVGSPLRKRAVEAATAAATVEPSAKRVCAEEQQSPSRGSTPEEEEDTSLFDNDATWTSVTTPGGSPAQRGMTRAQAREKAEILRLKLGLASYKVRTGQTDVPLSELVAKPLPRNASSNQQHDSDSKVSKEGGEDEVLELPQLKRGEGHDVVATPKRPMALRDDERLTSSALRGGAASGLLSLARGALGE